MESYPRGLCLSVARPRIDPRHTPSGSQLCGIGSPWRTVRVLGGTGSTMRRRPYRSESGFDRMGPTAPAPVDRCGDVDAQADTVSTVEVEGVVDSFTDADTIVVTFSSTWTPSTSEWFLVARDASSYNRGEGLARYAFVSDSGHLLDFADVSDASGSTFA